MSKIKSFFFSHRFNMFDVIVISLASYVLTNLPLSIMSGVSFAAIILISAFISVKMSPHSCGVQKEDKQ